MTQSNDLNVLVDAVAEAKVQSEQWTSIYDETRKMILTVMVDDQVKTFEQKTPSGDTKVTVVAPEPTIGIDIEKLRTKLKKRGLSVRAINKIAPPVVTYTLDEAALEDAIKAGVIKANEVPTYTAVARNPFLKVTVK